MNNKWKLSLKTKTSNNEQQKAPKSTFHFICSNSGPMEGGSNEKPERAMLTGNEKHRKAEKGNDKDKK